MVCRNTFYGKIFTAALIVILIGVATNAQPQIIFGPGVGPVSLEGQDVYRYDLSAETRRFLRGHSFGISEELLTYVNAPNDIVLPTDYKEFDDIAIRSEIDPSASIEMNADLLHLFVNSGLDGYDGEENTPGLPDSNDVAKEQLYIHLATLGLDLDENEIGGIQFGGVNMAVFRGVDENDNPITDDYRKFVTVRVSRKVDGLPVLGESRVVARLGENGNLHSLVYNWTPIANERSETPAELRSDEDINTQITEQLNARGAEATEITVNLSELVLFDDGTGAFEPVYYVVSDATYVNTYTDESGEEQQEELTMPLDLFVPILTNSTVRLPDYEDQPTEDI